MGVEAEAVQLPVQPAVEPCVLALAGKMTAHHYAGLLGSEQPARVAGREGILEVVGMYAAHARLLHYRGHAPGTSQVERTA